eukprot:GHVQ01004764.1.p2 GENE.GHVQ01004764.1~~GHVQ01004764.1.p2  ORF type:complete len:198 (-),score=30.35 GHVQ01004764.1:1375-1968(-)
MEKVQKLSNVPLGQLRLLKEMSQVPVKKEYQDMNVTPKVTKIVKKSREACYAMGKKTKAAPIELSSNKPQLPSDFKVRVGSRKIESRDPRFSDLSGPLSEHCFAQSYSFLNTIRDEEKKVLRSLATKNAGELSSNDAQLAKKMYQRMESQDVERHRRAKAVSVKKLLFKREKEDSQQIGKKLYYTGKGNVFVVACGW